MIIAGTGHRPNKLGNEYDYKGPYTDFIRGELERKLSHLKVDLIISGMAIGFDMILALVALKLGIKLQCYIPFKGQERTWPEPSQKLYHKILYKSNNIYIVDTNKVCSYNMYREEKQTIYHPIKMNDRNKSMVDIADMVISCHDGSTGGTANCIAYANSVNKPIIPINLKLINL